MGAEYDFLRQVPLFADLPDDDLDRLCAITETVRLPAGDELFAEGSTGDAAYIISEGQVEIVKSSGPREVLLAVRQRGDVIGEMSLVEESPRMATVRARTDAAFVTIKQEQFLELIDRSPSAARSLLHTVIARWRGTESMLRQSEKMAQLGTLTAGLAHELNNPAAAVQRGAEQLRSAYDAAREAELGLAQLGLDDDVHARVVGELGGVHERAMGAIDLDSLERSDREEAIEDWLTEQDVDAPWELASGLVNSGYTVEALADLCAGRAAAEIGVISRWLARAHALHSLLAEVRHGAQRISELVKSLKTYAYLDQAPVQEVDVHEGIESTLVLLRSKLKKGVRVHREFAADMPRIHGYGSELNQVWTNLFDNAIDAMEGEGELTLKTRRDGGFVIVEVIDSGPGIPEDIQAKIFNPFFTTKPPGKGTGLGLDISYNIIVNKHKGAMKVYSRPGRTCFEVRLPIDFTAVEAGAADVPGLDRSDDAELEQILRGSRRIAVVGASDREGVPANTVPAYLKRHGYEIVPVQSRSETVLGETVVPDLKSVQGEVDVVLIFRRPEAVPAIVDDAIGISPKVIWMQEGIVHEKAAAKAREAGLKVVSDTCMMATHKRIIGGG